MTSFDTTLASQPRLTQIFTRGWSAWTTYYDQRRTLQTLDALTERQLDDIGLTRADLASMR